MDEAIVHSQKAVEADPMSSGRQDELGGLLAKAKRWNEAEAAYRKAVKLAPKSSAAHNNLSLLLENTKRPKEAEVFLRKAIKLASNEVAIYKNLSALLRDVKRTKEAEAVFREGVEFNPQSALAHTGKLEDALKALRQALAIHEKLARENPTIIEYQTAIVILKALARAGYFKTTMTQALLQSESDLNALRHRKDFRDFAKSVGVDFPARAKKPLSAIIRQPGLPTVSPNP